MTATNQAVKSTAKSILNGKWAGAIAASAVVVLTQIAVIYATDVLLSVLNGIAVAIIRYAFVIFAGIPIFLGYLRLFRRKQWDTDDKVVAVFHYFSGMKTYKKALRFSFSLFCRIALIGIVVFIPYFAAYLLTNNDFYKLIGVSMPSWAANISLIPEFLKVISFALLIFVSLRYYLAPFLFVADEEMEPAECMLTSRIISKRTTIDFMSLILSFLLLIIVSLFLLPLIFTLPYLTVAYLVHCRYAVTEYNSVIKRLNNTTPFYSTNF